MSTPTPPVPRSSGSRARRLEPIYQLSWLLILAVSLLAAACSKTGSTRERAPAPSSSSHAHPAGSVDRQGRAVAVLAGGCFWGMQELLREVPGVIETEVGYTGGSSAHPSYQEVSSGSSGHAEAVRVVFDERQLSFGTLLEQWFFRMHDPTTKNRQGNDVGSQYRSAIFVSNERQRKVAKTVIDKLNKSGRFSDPIVTSIERAGTFTPAEDYHQDYLQKNPGGYTCHYLRDWT